MVIINKLAETFADADVRAAMTQTQCMRVDQVLQSTEPTDEDFRYLVRRLTRIYCQDD